MAIILRVLNVDAEMRGRRVSYRNTYVSSFARARLVFIVVALFSFTRYQRTLHCFGNDGEGRGEMKKAHARVATALEQQHHHLISYTTHMRSYHIHAKGAF